VLHARFGYRSGRSARGHHEREYIVIGRLLRRPPYLHLKLIVRNRLREDAAAGCGKRREKSEKENKGDLLPRARSFRIVRAYSVS
jgi:hypothetical protein